jgi:hypothetical protein
MAHAAPHLSARLIAKPLDDLRCWRLPDGHDLAGMHRGVLRALVATDSLARLELPHDMRAPRLDDSSEMAHWDTICALLDQAMGELCGPAHGQRILRLHRVAPGHAMQLERLRGHAVERLRRLRARIDFACGGAGEIAPAPRMQALARSITLQ